MAGAQFSCLFILLEVCVSASLFVHFHRITKSQNMLSCMGPTRVIQSTQGQFLQECVTTHPSVSQWSTASLTGLAGSLLLAES